MGGRTDGRAGGAGPAGVQLTPAISRSRGQRGGRSLVAPPEHGTRSRSSRLLLLPHPWAGRGGKAPQGLRRLRKACLKAKRSGGSQWKGKRKPPLCWKERAKRQRAPRQRRERSPPAPSLPPRCRPPAARPSRASEGIGRDLGEEPRPLSGGRRAKRLPRRACRRRGGHAAGRPRRWLRARPPCALAGRA